MARFLKGVLCVLAVLLVVPGAWGAGVTGSLSGTVTDTSGAVVPGATVYVTSEATGVIREAETDSTGSYVVLELLPGKYSVKVEKQGFRAGLVTGVEVLLAVRALQNVTLEVGQLVEVVEVAADAVRVEATTIQGGGTISGALLAGLPLPTRDWTDLAKLLPGVQEDSDRLGNSVNGGRTTSNSFLFNGNDANDPALNTNLVVVNPDAVGEFRLINSTMDAEYTRNSGSILNAIPRSGTNDFHGTLGYFYRHKGLTARNFFDTRIGAGDTKADNPDFKRHQWSATVGGPIAKDRTFFFGSYQGLRQAAPQRIGIVERTYTAAERACIDDPAVMCDWSRAYPVGFAGTSPGIPGCAAGVAFNTCFPGAQIPFSSVNPITAGVIGGVAGVHPGYPLPNSGIDGFNGVLTAPLKNYQYLARLNHNFARGHTLDGILFSSNQTSTSPFSFTGGTVPGWGHSSVSFIRNFSLSYTHIFSPRTVNEARFGYNRLRFLSVQPVNVIQPSDPALGFTGITVQDPLVASAPRLSPGSGWADWGFSVNGPQPRIDETVQYTDNLTLIRGKHSLKFGFDIRNIDVFNPFRFVHNGFFAFSGNRLPNLAGNGALGANSDAGLLQMLGISQGYQQSSGAINHPGGELYYFYAQDQWRIRPTLTLNFGLGWQLKTPSEQITADHQLMIQLCPGQQSTLFPTGPQVDGFVGPWFGPPSGLCYPADGLPDGTIPFRKKDFGPRIGFAWAPQAQSGVGRWITGGPGHFSIRAGYGIFYNIQIEELQLQFLLTPPFSLINVLGNFSNSTRQLQFPFCAFGTACASQPYPFFEPPAGALIDWAPLFYFPLNQQGYNPDFKNAYAQNWHLTIERKFGNDWIFRGAYVGSKGTHLETAIEQLTEGFDGNTGTPTAGLPGGRVLLGVQDPSFTTDVAPLIGFTCDFFDDGFNDCLWQSFSEQSSNINSIYHSLQVNVEKRFTRGLQLLGSYTWSHSIDEASNNGVEDFAATPFGRHLDRTNSDFDARHRFVVSYVWDIPAPRWTGAAGKLVRGWQLTGITTFATGFPIALSDGLTPCDATATVSFFGTWCRPSLTGPLSGFTTLGDPRDNPGNAYFDTSLFTATIPGEVGGVARREFHGPGINNWDIGIYKNTYIDAEESKYIQARFEFFNAFNHVQFNTPSGNVSSSLFGRSTGAAAARIVQLSLKFIF